MSVKPSYFLFISDFSNFLRHWRVKIFICLCKSQQKYPISFSYVVAIYNKEDSLRNWPMLLWFHPNNVGNMFTYLILILIKKDIPLTISKGNVLSKRQNFLPDCNSLLKAGITSQMKKRSNKTSIPFASVLHTGWVWILGAEAQYIWRPSLEEGQLNPGKQSPFENSECLSWNVCILKYFKIGSVKSVE